eukprot:3011750-Prymnesium_polylepis.1
MLCHTLYALADAISVYFLDLALAPAAPLCPCVWTPRAGTHCVCTRDVAQAAARQGVCAGYRTVCVHDFGRRTMDR